MLAGLDACTRCTLTRFQWLPLRALAPTVSPIGRVSWTVLVILNLTFSAGKVSRATTRCLHHGIRSLTIDGDTVILLLFCNRHETLISPGCFILHVGLAVTKLQDHLSHPDGVASHSRQPRHTNANFLLLLPLGILQRATQGMTPLAREPLTARAFLPHPQKAIPCQTIASRRQEAAL